MSKRNAIRVGQNPHEAESVMYAVDRYGMIEKETLDEIVTWLEAQSDKYKWEIGLESFPEYPFVEPHPFIKTQMKGSALYKIIDNEHDAQNTLANIRNKEFPKNRQGN